MNPQSLSISGSHFSHDKHKDVSLVTWNNNKTNQLVFHQYKFIYDVNSAAQFEKVYNFKPVIHFGNVHHQATSFRLNFFSFMPRTSKSLAFRFLAFQLFSWLEVQGTPVEAQKEISYVYHQTISLHQKHIKACSPDHNIPELTVASDGLVDPVPKVQLHFVVHTQVWTQTADVVLMLSKLFHLFVDLFCFNEGHFEMRMSVLTWVGGHMKHSQESDFRTHKNLDIKCSNRKKVFFQCC